MAKDERYRRMIHTQRWVMLRARKLIASPWCERCLENDIHTVATEVHHVHPVEDGMNESEMRRLMFDPHNLRSLCHDCHVLTHTEMGRGGKAHAKRKAEAQLESFKRKFFP